jgi:hypothetical protein
MSEEPIGIALPKLFLWSEPSRFQEYPAAMARAEAGRVYTRLEVERELFDILPTMEYKGGMPRGRRTDGIVNTYGLERSGVRYRISGINLLRKEAGGLLPTEDGLELGRLFRDSSEGFTWPIALARQILLREPRTRLLIGLMLSGAQLEVAVSGSTLTGSLVLVHGDVARGVITQRNCTWFNDLLCENAEMALGPCWQQELEECGIRAPIRWEGVQGDQPSTNDLPTALKKALAVFFHIRLFAGDGETWKLDSGHLKTLLGDEVAGSFKVSGVEKIVDLPDDEAFGKALAHTVDSDGFVIISQLADRFGELLSIPAPDRAAFLDSYVRSAMYHDQVRLLEHHRGQPRMGRGLFGDNDSRQVRLDFNPSVHHDIKSNAPGKFGAVKNTDAGGS